MAVVAVTFESFKGFFRVLLFFFFLFCFVAFFFGLSEGCMSFHLHLNIAVVGISFNFISLMLVAGSNIFCVTCQL